MDDTRVRLIVRYLLATHVGDDIHRTEDERLWMQVETFKIQVRLTDEELAMIFDEDTFLEDDMEEALELPRND